MTVLDYLSSPPARAAEFALINGSGGVRDVLWVPVCLGVDSDDLRIKRLLRMGVTVALFIGRIEHSGALKDAAEYFRNWLRTAPR